MIQLRTVLHALLLAILLPPAVAAEDAPSRPAGVDELLSSMDRGADPCRDFYRYACGGWRDETELPPDQSRWSRSFSAIHERNREIVRDLLEAAAAEPGEKGSDRYRTGHLYGSCMDTAAVEKAGAEPLAGGLEAISAVEGPESLLTVGARLQRQGVPALFDLGVIPDFKQPDLNIAFFSQGGIGMPDRDYYLSEDERKQELLGAYEAQVAHMLGLLGTETEVAAERARAVVAFETALAEASRPRAEMRVPETLYHRLDRKGLARLTPELPWDAFFEATGFPGITAINVATPEFFEALEAEVLEASAETLRAYLAWHLVNTHAGRLSSPFVEADFAFYGKKLSGQQEIEPRWKRCVAATEQALGEAVGKLYVEEHFPGESKEIAVTMIGDIERAFENGLADLGWMGEKTRGRALEKMHAIVNKIGYPDEWRDYSAMEIEPGSYFDNALAAAAFEFDRQARKVGEPVDPDEWQMNPQRVNAYYSPFVNEIVFPAGILQPPFFHRDFPIALNYGAIGTVMGHELTHGFDDQGRKFSPTGKLEEWWEPEVAERFEKRAQCVEETYSGFEVEPGVAVQGSLTLGENIADIGGLKQSYRAYRRWAERQDEVERVIPELTNEQLLFISYAQAWCSVMSPEAARMMVTTDSHSPPRFRVIGPVSNHPGFGEAFGCEPGTPMNPRERCEVW